MPSTRVNYVAIAATVLYVVGVLLYGVLVLNSLLLAVLMALPGPGAYLVWRVSVGSR